MLVKERVNDIIKSQEDQRSYRGLLLNNDLKVLLISDTETDMAAAAMDIHIGSMSDPENLPGLAHFCEHMLFLGTEKYPCENEYNKYLNEHSGKSNAFTSSDHTNYYFCVAPDALPGALDRFAQFFLSPLFTESCVSREVNAIHSEHEKNLKNDIWRLSQLEKSTADPSHDFCKFGTGNLVTLDKIPKENGICVKEELLKFHKKWYSSNIMALAVLGKESLDDLESLVVELFNGVENKSVQIPCWDRHPFGPEQCRKIGYVVPVKDIRKLNITFPIPDMLSFYKTNPCHYLSHFIGHEGAGSLLSYLKELGWVNNLIAGQQTGAKGFSFFIINVDLTDDGLEHTNDIVTAVFQYLNLLKSVRPQEWAFEEIKNLSDMKFQFKDKEPPVSYACYLAETMHRYPLREALCGDHLVSEYKPDLISTVLDMLTADKIRLAVVSQKMEDKAEECEKWYGTKYLLNIVDDELLHTWKHAGENTALFIPPKNEFIPTSFEIYKCPEELKTYPELIEYNTLCHIWYKLDDEYKLPKCVFFVEVRSPLSSLSPHNYNNLSMFVKLLRDALTEYVYAAELAGLLYHVNNTQYGLTLSINGFSDNQDVLLAKIVQQITAFQVNPKRFEVLKEKFIRDLKNFEAEQPHQHVTYYATLLLSERGWSKGQLLDAMQYLSVYSVEKFVPEFLSSLHFEFLIHGNISKENALKMAHVVTNTFQSNGTLLPEQLVRLREIELPNGGSYVYKKENHVHKSSATEVYLQCGLQSPLSNILLELLCQIVNESAYHELRTKEQLGYIVWLGARWSKGTKGLRIIIQGDKNPQYLDSRIEAFIHKVGDIIGNITEEEFIKHKESLKMKRLERPKHLAHLSSVWWSEIYTGQYFFNRELIEVEFLKDLSKSDILNFYKLHISSNADERKKLAIYIYSTANDDICCTEQPVDVVLSSVPVCKEAKEISSISSFRLSSSLCPLVQPYIEIPNVF